MEQNTKLAWKGGALLAPVPAVMVSCGSLEKPNIVTVAWTGTLCSDPPKTYIALRHERYSYHLIEESGKFVINLTTEALVKAADYCGVRSGRDHNKFEECHLTAVPALSLPDTPAIAESPISLECRVEQIIPLGSHDLFLASIEAVEVSPSLVDENGRLRLDKAGLVAYAHGDYYALGKWLGDFGFSVRKKARQKNGRTFKKPPKEKK